MHLFKKIIIFISYLITFSVHAVTGVIELVEDINSQAVLFNDSSPTDLTVFQNKLYFRATDGINGTELWEFNGTTVTRISDINTSGSSQPSDLTVFNNKLYFEASDGSTGAELWVFDGSNTSLVSDINLSGSSSPVDLTIFNDTLYFQANDGIAGIELWSFDGSTTNLVSDINPSGSSSPQGFTIFDNKLYFQANDGTNGEELWVFDGTSTSLVSNINTSGSSSPSDFAVFNNKLYFQANDGTNGEELWVYDGISSSLVNDINPSGNSSPEDLIVFNDILHFQADDGTFGKELWSYDGIETTRISDINTSGNGTPVNLTLFNSQLYFQAFNTSSTGGLWVYDGSVISEIDNTNSFQLVSQFAVFNNILYFSAFNTSVRTELHAFTPTNYVPIISGEPNTDVDEYSSYSFIPSVTDVDMNDIQTFSIINAPLWSDFNQTTGELSGIPTKNDIGIFSNIIITTTDSTNESNDLPSFSLSVNDIISIPTVSNITTTVNEDTAVLITLNGNDIDEGDLAYTIVTQTVNGALTPTDDDNVFTYLANENYNGTDSFTYQVNDGENNSSIAQVDISITAINDIPVANTVVSSLDEDTPTLITLNGRDVENTDLTYNIITQPINGTLTATDDANIFTYLPNENFSGGDNFTYQVNDGEADSSNANVTLEIAAVNDSPVAEVDNVETIQGSAITIDVLANDSDIDGDTIIITNAEVSPDAGLLEISDGFLIFIPTNSFTGTVTINYSISDSNNAVSSSTVNVVVNSSESIEVNGNSSSGGSMAYLILILLSISALRSQKLVT